LAGQHAGSHASEEAVPKGEGRAELPFYLPYDKMYREGVLVHAYALVVVI
jgi:hypothetical protein